MYSLIHLKVFKSPKTQGGGAANSDTAQQTAESILNFFPGFDAFKLPPPSTSPEVTQNLNSAEQGVNESFLKGVEEFAENLRRRLVPKRSFNDGEFVTGEGSANFR